MVQLRIGRVPSCGATVGGAGGLVDEVLSLAPGMDDDMNGSSKHDASCIAPAGLWLPEDP